MRENCNRKYFDLQVNGYAGIDFNKIDLCQEELESACLKLIDDGVEGILATIITDDYSRMLTKLKNLSNIILSNSKISSVIKGIHVEGPFLSPELGYRGAHPEEYIIPASISKAEEMLNSANGLIKLFTLSPESDEDCELTKCLSDQNIVVSAGHSNATIDQLNAAIDNGLQMFTHLGNGAPIILPRHDNIINRVLSLSEKLYICFIADGIHIPDFALKNYLKVAKKDNCIITTDCMAAASAPPGEYSISHIDVEVGIDKIVRELGKDNLAGSAIRMKDAEEFLYTALSCSELDLERFLYRNTKALLKL